MIEQRRQQPDADRVDPGAHRTGGWASDRVTGGDLCWWRQRGQERCRLRWAGCQLTVVDSSADAARRGDPASQSRRTPESPVGSAGIQADAESLAQVASPVSATEKQCCATTGRRRSTIRVLSSSRWPWLFGPGGYVSVLTAGRLGAVLGQTGGLAGSRRPGRCSPTPDGRSLDNDPLRRRYDTVGGWRVTRRCGACECRPCWVPVCCPAWSPGAAPASRGRAATTSLLGPEEKAEAARYLVLREIAADLHIVARRPGGRQERRPRWPGGKRRTRRQRPWTGGRVRIAVARHP